MNQVAIITGASRGIGAATALRLANDGYDICVNYVANQEAAESVVTAVRALGRQALAVKADISSADQVKYLFEQSESALGSPSALINNAGILFQQASLEDLTAERISAVMATNVIGTFMCCQEAVRRMSTKHGGTGGGIVNVSSVAAKTGSPGEYTDYAASKGAVDSLTIGLAAEVAQQGIRVNAVRPSFIYTQMHASGGEPDRVERVKELTPMKRGGQPEEVAAAIAWLLSDQASYTTGSFIDVTGGKHA